MPYAEESQKRHSHIYGQLNALRLSIELICGTRKSTTIDGITVTAVVKTLTYVAFEADQFTGSYAMSIAECTEYLTTKLTNQTEVFTVREGEYQVIVDGIIVAATFNSKGAAKAAIPVERARRLKNAARPIPLAYKK